MTTPRGECRPLAAALPLPPTECAGVSELRFNPKAKGGELNSVHLRAVVPASTFAPARSSCRRLCSCEMMMLEDAEVGLGWRMRRAD